MDTPETGRSGRHIRPPGSHHRLPRQARTAVDTDWSRIAAFYAELATLGASPIIELNRAVAVGMAEGPEAGLSIVEYLMREPALKGYHLLPSVRGDLLHELGATKRRVPRSKRPRS